MNNQYADLIIPVALPGTFTYAIPTALVSVVHRGSLVSVGFGQSDDVTALVVKIHGDKPEEGITVREIGSLIPGEASLNERLTGFLEWLSDYYLAYPGEVLRAAIPSPGNLPGRVAARRGKGEEDEPDFALRDPSPLNDTQAEALESIKQQLTVGDTVLLHGVTSSGKTEIYIHLMKEQMESGRQVLYMLPEIALTTQIIDRLKRHFGSAIGVYHSRLTPAARREVWKRTGDGTLKAVLGVRSSLFLPFSDLGLIVVDEEHDSSYKQYDPAPRYHARDAAMMLARIHGGKTLLGSATPSLESWHNAHNGRYGLVELMTRYGNVMLPAMIIADTRRGGRKRSVMAHFTAGLIEAVTEALAKEEQVILFQNRRGFSPYLMCADCGFVPQCSSCSVSLTYHKRIGRLICHYCGRSVRLPSGCPECGSANMLTRGFGTEKIEEEIRLLFPSARVARMDQDTVRSRNAAAEILRNFACGETDILVGTQMISKGLDFERLTVVGILDADSMMYFPDFRAHERSFQMIAQVSGRAGRRNTRGKVIIQTADPANLILRQVLRNDYHAMSMAQLEERALFGYPPFTRLITISVKHREREVADRVAEELAGRLRRHLGNGVLGPEYPLVMQVQRWYIKEILVKIGESLSPARVKELLRREMEISLKNSPKGLLRIYADVDPQ